MVSYLCEELTRLGQEVTLFASADSCTSAKLVPVCQRALRLDENCIDPLAHHILQLERVLQAANEFHLIHFHTDYLHFPFSRRNAHRHLTTLHGRLDMADLAPLFREFSDMPLVSISNSQREPLPGVNWQATIHHGIPEDQYQPSFQTGKYLAFVGRISPEKRVERAIEIARRVDMPLRISAKIAEPDRAYYQEQIAPLMKHPLVEFLGEIGEEEKQELLANAYALLFPIDWPEPFGLVMVEAMACGTPVIAFRRGAVPEVVEHGVTGFIVDSLDEAIHAVEAVPFFDRAACHARFLERFTAERMARQYLEVYERLMRPRELESRLVA